MVERKFKEGYSAPELKELERSWIKGRGVVQPG